MNATEKVLSALKKDRRYKFRDLKSISRATNGELVGILNTLRAAGHKIVLNRFDRTYYLSRIPTPYSNYFDMTWLPLTGKLGLVSDTHLCSVADRLDLLAKAYDDFAKQGIKTVLHCGDIIDGWDVYKGHIQFVKEAGGANQARYAIKNYPMRTGLKTYFIAGNHDLRSFEKDGIDVCSLIVNGFDHHDGTHTDGRKDLVYLGQYSRTLMFPNDVTVQLIHPRGGNAYARSYPQQKRAREMHSETRPNLQVSGHYHTFTWIIEDITSMLALSGFQDETEFFVRQGYSRQIGYCIADYTIDRRKFSRFKVEYVDVS
jgi:UDP-2,3-diacylglucosamine pyrophosphatase LpxH